MINLEHPITLLFISCMAHSIIIEHAVLATAGATVMLGSYAGTCTLLHITPREEHHATSSSCADFVNAHRCRLAWSPDGRYLTAVNCYENSHHAAILLERGSWAPADTDGALKMMGHKAAVLVARYNPKMFRSSDAENRHSGSRPAPDLCLALGSQASPA